MTVEKALEIMRSDNTYTCVDCDYNCEECEYFIAQDVAIEALEKQVPMKPVADDYFEDMFRCCKCKSLVVEERKENYCAFCGQKIKWGEEE